MKTAREMDLRPPYQQGTTDTIIVLLKLETHGRISSWKIGYDYVMLQCCSASLLSELVCRAIATGGALWGSLFLSD